MEPSIGSQPVSNAIRTVFTDSYDVLQLSGQKSSAILAQPRNSSRRLMVTLAIDRIKRNVPLRLQIIISRVDQSSSACYSIAAHARIRKRLCLKTRAPGVAPVWELRITVDFVQHASRSAPESRPPFADANSVRLKRDYANVQEQPRSCAIFPRRNRNRYWNREPFRRGTVRRWW
jgi:hypothetical protein